MRLRKHSHSTVRTRSHRKQVLLFLIAVVLPSALLIVLTWHMIGQQQELSEKRWADKRHRVAREISQKMLVQLEDIKLREVSVRAGETAPLDTHEYSSDAVILIGLARGEQLLLPWELCQSNDKLELGNTDFSVKIRRAEEEEFMHRRFAQAHALYTECLADAENPTERAYLQLLRARVLAKLEQVDQSLAEYRRVLAVNPRISDEHGIPLCLYAAGRLLERDDSRGEVMQLVERELAARHLLSPAESYIIRDLVNVLVESGKDSGGKQAAENLQQQILKHISLQEEALALQRGFPKLTLMAQWRAPEQEADPVWVPYGEELWLVSLAPGAASRPRLAIVVRAKRILDSIAASTPDSEAIPANVRLTTGTDLDGESLGPSFPGLGLAYTTDNGISMEDDWGLQRSFYLIALFLVLCATLFGAYFLWRDVGRELRMAEMRSQFIASVSHELKTPLTAIRIFAETLGMGRLKDAQAKREYLDTIVNESHRLTRLLNNVLDFSKIEKGKRGYRKELISLSNIVNAAVQATQYPLTQHDFHLNVNMEDELPDLRVDRDAIEQAILNLLSNAMKYAGASNRIDLRVQRRADYIVIEVSDQGIGIDPAQQKRIFEKFYRVPSAHNQRIPGTGLGLALVLHIVQAHDGQVEVRSALGQGSTFSIHLPVGPVENKA